MTIKKLYEIMDASGEAWNSFICNKEELTQTLRKEANYQDLWCDAIENDIRKYTIIVYFNAFYIKAQRDGSSEIKARFESEFYGLESLIKILQTIEKSVKGE